MKQWSEMLGTDHVYVTREVSWALFLGLFAFNYLAILRHGRWEAYLASFRSYPEQRQLKIKWLARLALVLITIACAYTFLHFTRSS